ncbi:MAG: redoxin domain-containing protein [Saprospiraceae bacterium]|nr:redoxin domain-containing protein [Saprospiraceae bacterium]
MTRYSLLCLLFCVSISTLFGQNALNLTIELEGYTNDTLYLGYYYGDKTYLADTAGLDANGQFVFEADTALKAGMYLIVLQPKNNYAEILLSADNQAFLLKADANDLVKTMAFEGSKQNALFYEYLGFISDLRPKAQALQQQMQTSDAERQAAIREELNQMDNSVRTLQEDIVQNNPGSLVASVIGANINLKMPEFEGTTEEIQYKQFYYTRDHYFDHIDLTDSRLLRSSFLFGRVNNYVENLNIQVPDSIIKGVDYILQNTQSSEDMFRFWLIHFLNKYAGSKTVGMDAVYVHIANNYYGKGMATWTEPEQLEKILNNAKKLEPLLIGKIAPNIAMQKQDGSPVALYDIGSEYTILYFWRYDCGHCKESTPYMKDFYEQFKDRDITLMAACLKFTDEVGGCWDYIEENEITDWLHTVDPYGRSRFHEKYDLRTTPQIYVLNRDKEIIMKKIGAEQLSEVMEKLIELDERKKQNPSSGER